MYTLMYTARPLRTISTPPARANVADINDNYRMHIRACILRLLIVYCARKRHDREWTLSIRGLTSSLTSVILHVSGLQQSNILVYILNIMVNKMILDS